MERLKETALHGFHVEAGGKMVAFAGYSMPMHYGSVMEEHKQVRTAVGLFDVSHMGKISVSGAQAGRCLQHTTTNDVSKLSRGKVQYSCVTNEKGFLLDDVLVYCLAPDTDYLVVVNASNTDKMLHWWRSHAGSGVSVKDLTDSLCILALQGLQATKQLQPLVSSSLGRLSYYTCAHMRVSDASNILVSATGYTGSGGYELYVPKEEAAHVWKALVASGAQPCGLGARDTLRLEMGYCLYGQDISENITPLEAGLGWVTKLETNFIGSAALKKHKEHGLKRRLTGLMVEDKGLVRSGDILTLDSGEEVGMVTSGGFSPTLGLGIGLGYIKVPHHRPDTLLLAQTTRGKTLRITTKKPPFVKTGL